MDLTHQSTSTKLDDSTKPPINVENSTISSTTKMEPKDLTQQTTPTKMDSDVSIQPQKEVISELNQKSTNTTLDTDDKTQPITAIKVEKAETSFDFKDLIHSEVIREIKRIENNTLDKQQRFINKLENFSNRLITGSAINGFAINLQLLLQLILILVLMSWHHLRY